MKAKQKKMYLSTADVAQLLGMSRRRACYWLKREGAVRKHGRHYYTTAERLAAAFPDVFQTLAKD